MTLYEINYQIQQLTDEMVDPETGEIRPEFLEQLEALQMEREVKLMNVGLAVKNIDAEAKAIKAEEAALAARRKVLENKSKRLRDYLMEGLEGSAMKTPQLSITFRRTVPAVKFDSQEDEAIFIEWAKGERDDLLRFPDPELNKTAIKQAILDGQDLRYAHLESGTTMIIK